MKSHSLKKVCGEQPRKHFKRRVGNIVFAICTWVLSCFVCLRVFCLRPGITAHLVQASFQLWLLASAS